MRRLQLNILVLFGIVFLAIGCEKVIDLKTDDVSAKYVIEGTLSDWPRDCRVVITSLLNIDDPSVFDGVSGASVTIVEDDNTGIILHEVQNGIYFTGELQAKPGHKYTLNVVIDDHKFTSTVTVPESVHFDSLYITDFSSFGQVRKFANILFQDPPGVANSYRFLQYKNNVRNSNIFVMNDDFSDGRPIDTFLAFFDDTKVQNIESGDTVRVQMQCIDPSVYLYFNSLNLSGTGENSVIAPGNPITNIEGGALGYFSAYTRQDKTVIVP